MAKSGRRFLSSRSGELGTAPVEIWSDREDVAAAVTKDGKKLEVKISPDAKPGLCWFRLWNKEGASALEPFVIGRLPEVSETEPNETINQAKSNVLGHVINGKLHKTGELDTFKVTLRKGETLVADLLGNKVLGSPMDAVLQVFSAEGFLLGHADDSPMLDPRLVFKAPIDGDYYIRVFAFPATATSSIRYAGGADFVYRLTLTTGPYVHHRVPLVWGRGKQIPTALKGWNIPAEGTPAELPSRLPQLHRSVDHAVLVEDPNKQDSLTPPFSLTGHIEKPDEIDRYRITGKKGQTLLVKVESTSLGFPLDPVLEIKDANGSSLKVIDDKTRGVEDAEFTWKVPADGNYEIQIKDRYQHGGWDYAYVLTVEEPKPDFQLSLAADVFTLADKPLDIPVTVTRANGFAEKIEVKVDGLPEGITAEAVVSEPKGATAKAVKLKLTANGKEPFHGPVWITGKAGGLEKKATTPSSQASPEAQHAWISFEPK